MNKLVQELNEIGKLVSSTLLINAVRREVKAAVKNQTGMVVTGEHAEKRAKGSSQYDVVVMHEYDNQTAKLVARRIKANIPNIEVDAIVDNVIGIRGSRRGK